jgi:hypothetical protein
MTPPAKTLIDVSSNIRSWVILASAFTLITVIILSFSSYAFANPVGYEPSNFFGGLIWLFGIEGIVLAFLVGIRKIRKIRFILLWTVITFLTWILFYLWIALLSLHANTYLVMIMGEVTVVIGEAYILRALISSGKFTRDNIRLSLSKALWFSFLANSASCAGGFLLLYLSTVTGSSPCLPFWDVKALTEKAERGDIVAANKLQGHYSMCVKPK